MDYLITSITQLLTIKGDKKPRKGKELKDIGVIKNAALYISDGKIKYYGREREVIEKVRNKNYIEVKANGVVMPGFVDSHTHSVFARARIEDFEMRIKGFSYQEIKKAGGGILKSVADVRNASKDELEENLLFFSRKFLEYGTTTVEVKSGYGLDFENEIKILEVIKDASKKTEVEFVPTFLGAHSIPIEFKKGSEYLEYLKEHLIPYVAKNKLSEYVDIFCEKGYFGKEESLDYLNYAKKYSLKPRIHADQLSRSGGSIVASKVCAITADHLDFANLYDMRALKKSNVIANFLPASNYFLGLSKYPDIRGFIENGNIVSLASDFNPGTSPTWNMQFVISLALTYCKMSIEEAIVASTYNASFAVERGERIGMIDEAMDGDVIVLDIKDYRELGYYFGVNLNKITFKKGKIVYEKNNSI